MALIVSRKKLLLNFLVASSVKSHYGQVCPSNRSAIISNVVTKQHCSSNVRFCSSFVQPNKLCWEGSNNVILLKKLQTALKDHQTDEAWETFNDFKRFFGFPDRTITNSLVLELSYSLDPHWLRKAADLVFTMTKDKSYSLKPDVLTKLLLSLARADMPVPCVTILRLMLDKESLPSMDILRLVYLHLVKTEIGVYLSTNLLIEICDFHQRLTASKSSHANRMKLDTMIFNLVLDACVRFKLYVKSQEILELMSQTGIFADAHTIVIIAWIHEMNGQRDELKKFKHHIDELSVLFLCHYRQFYDSLLSLHFKFGDIDAAVDLLLTMHENREPYSHPGSKLRKDPQKSYFVSIGSDHIRNGLKLQISPELLHKDCVLELEEEEKFVIYRNGKLLPSNRALAKLIIAHKGSGKTKELSKFLLNIQKLFGDNLCSDVVEACIHLGWLETAHDILDDMKFSGQAGDSTIYMSLIAAYNSREMYREANALVKKTRIDFLNTNKPSLVVNSDLVESLIQEAKSKENKFPLLLFEVNSSIYYFTKAKMIEDALKTYRGMQDMKIRPSVQTYAYMASGYSSLGSYRDITFLWGDMKRDMESASLEVSRDMYEFLLISFLRGGYFERVMEVISYMEKHNMFTDKWMYKCEFLKLHKNLYRTLRSSEARNETQRKRLEFVRSFKKWAGVQ
ncbi:hypothetical protein ACFE04_031405 [Oxalis oulophora]